MLSIFPVVFEILQIYVCVPDSGISKNVKWLMQFAASSIFNINDLFATVVSAFDTLSVTSADYIGRQQLHQN